VVEENFEDDPVENSVGDARSALNELFLLAKQFNSSDEYRRFINFLTSFHRYSLFNATLVYLQMQGATHVLTARRWVDDYGRRPKPNAQPLVMLQPMGPVMFGFDVSQTEGRELPHRFANPFPTKGIVPPDVMRLTKLNAAKDGVAIYEQALGSTLGGYVRDANSPHHVVGVGMVQDVSRRFIDRNGDVAVTHEITLNSNLPGLTQYSTLTHELGHLYCGHVGTPKERWWPNRRKLDKQTREFEAESVSFLVCRRLGVDTDSAFYLHGYLDSHRNVPGIDLDAVIKAAVRVEAMGKRVLPMRKSKTKEAENPGNA